MEYLARHNKVWQKIGTDKPLTDRLTLKDGEKLTDYQQIPKSKEQPKPKEEPRQRGVKKSDYFNSDKNNDEKGEF